MCLFAKKLKSNAREGARPLVKRFSGTIPRLLRPLVFPMHNFSNLFSTSALLKWILSGYGFFCFFLY